METEHCYGFECEGDAACCSCDCRKCEEAIKDEIDSDIDDL